MKKTLLASGLLFAAPLASADFLGVFAGAGQWQGDYSGNLGDPNFDVDVSELGLSESDNNYFYLAFEHPIPMLPNARIQHTDISSRQTGTIERTFRIEGETFVAGEEIDSELDLTHTDFTLYYELLDNWVNLDLGITLRRFDGFVTAEGSFGNEQSVDIDPVIPMVYGKAQFDLPFTGFSVGGQGNVISYDDNRLTDLSVNASYTFQSLLDLGVEIGYRQMNLELDEDVTADIDLKGPYAAVTLHF